MTIIDRVGNVPEGLGIKAPVLCATTAPITLAGLQTIDGIDVPANARVLVKDQLDARQNGIYQASSGNWTRPHDADKSESFIAGTQVYVSEGTLNELMIYVVTTNVDPIVVGSNLITWAALRRVGDPAIARSIHLNDNDVDADMTLPLKAARLGKALAFDPATGAVTVIAVVAGALEPDASNISYTPPWSGGSVRSISDRLSDKFSVFDFIPSTQHTAISNGSTSYDATADIQAAIDAADGAELYLPAGKFLVQQLQRLTSVSDQWRNGMKLIGQGRGTNLVGTANNKAVLKWDVGYTPDGTITPTLKYTRDSELRGILITQNGGVTGTDGIRLTAAWNVRMSDVWVEGMSGKGLSVPFRSDIYAAVSDYWQCFGLEMLQCRFSECTDWGVYMGGGQSPGLWRMQFCTIASNAGGGVYDTTGQFVFTDNLVVANGTFGANGGMLVDASVEGVSFNATIERNEFDTNFVYHLWMLRCRNHRIAQNRYLSQTYLTDTSATLSSGSSHMRPPNHVKLGDGGTKEVWNCNFELNYHRSVTGAGPTTAAVNAYVMTGGSTQVLRNRFSNNDIQNRDGVSQNSTNMVRYSGIVCGTDANSIIEGNRVGLSATASGATSVAGTMTTIAFATTVFDTHTAFASPSFTAPVAGRYHIVSTVQIAGLATGNVVNLAVFVNGVQVRASQSYVGLGQESFLIDVGVLLAESDTVTIRATQNSGSGKNTTADSTTRLYIAQES